MAPCVEPLEVRLVPTVISHTSDGNLLIETSDNVLVDRDQIEIRADVTNSKFIISDSSQTLISNISGTMTSPDQHVVEIPFSRIPVATRLLVETFAGDDLITLSAEGGSFGLSPLINGGGGFDNIVSTAAILVATANEDLFLLAENIRLGGNLTTNGGKITLEGNVRLTDNVILTTAGASSGFVQINGQLDSAAGPSNYTLITTPRTYADAQRQAAFDVPGGYLVTIRSAVEQAEAKAAAGNNDVWIGASDTETEGQWRWDSGPDFGVQFWDGTTGNPVNGEYSNWFPGEPDDLPSPGDAAFLTGNDPIGGSAAPGGWSDGDSNTPRAYIVESPTAFSLTVNSGTANVLLNGSVGNQIPLRFLDVTANRTDLVGGSVSTFKSQTYNSSVAMNGPTLLRAEDVNFGGGSNSVSGTANLTLAPIKRDAPITVGGTTDAGTASFDITDTDIAALAIGFASIQIGEPPFVQGQGQGQGQTQAQGFQVQSTGPVTVTTASFLSPVVIAGGSISVTGLDAGTNKVDLIASLGSITGGGNAVVDITAGELSLDSATGVGASNDAFDTSVAVIAARTAEGGDVFIANNGDLAIGSPRYPGGIFANTGQIFVTTTGSMTVVRSIVSRGGDVRLTATNGIVIDGVPVDTRFSDATAGDFTADADSDNNGSGTFSINSVTDFVDWTSTTQGVFADGTTVDITTTTLASALAQINPGDTRFSDENIYFPAQASGDFVETRFSQVSEAVFFTFSNPQFGLFLHFDGMQFQGTPFDPNVDNPINLYSFDRRPSKASGESTWDVDQATNSIRQLSGDHLADQDGTVRFDERVSSLTFSRAALGVKPEVGRESIVNVQLGLFRAGGIMASGGVVTLRAADVQLNGFLDAGSQSVTFLTSGTSHPINLGSETAGSLSLTDAELDGITASMIQIGDFTSGPFTVSETIDRVSPTAFLLRTGGDHSITFSGNNAQLNSGTGDVILSLDPSGAGGITSGDALTDIVAGGVLLTSGAGGIGASGNPLITDGMYLHATTSGHATAFLSEMDSITISEAGLTAGTGAIHLVQGVFRLSASDQVDAASRLVIESGATFQFDGFDQTLGGLSGDGSVVNGSRTFATLTIDCAGAELFAGTLGGAGTDDNNFELRKSGDGFLALLEANTYSGSTTVMAGDLVLVGSITSDVLVQGSGTLAGSGKILGTHTLTVVGGGTLAPGKSRTLNSGSVTFGNGSNFNVELNGPQGGQGHDQLNVTGTVDLSGGTLNATLGFTPAAGATFVIINNDGSDPITTTFVGIPQNSLLKIGGSKFHILYDFNNGGGQANDVALIVNRPPVISTQNFTVDKTATSGTAIGKVLANDADSSVTFLITAGNSSKTFDMDLSGQLKINDATALASTRSFSLTVEVTDDAGATKSALITINVLSPEPDAPSDADGSNRNRNDGLVPEGAIAGTRVGITLAAADPQNDDVFYRLTDDAGGRFTVDPLTGVVTVKTSHLLNFAKATQHTIRAQAVDASGNASPEATFGIDVVEVPADALPIASILPSRVSVVEGDPTDPGHRFISFLVKLNKPSVETVQIDFSTRVGDEPGFIRPEGIPADASFASDVPDSGDFFRSAGRLAFDPGITEQTVRVQLRPDDNPNEVNELFFVQLRLSKDVPVNVRLSAGQSVAVAEILEDDSVPQVVVENTQVLEGAASGQKELVFRLNLVGTFPLGLLSATVDYLSDNVSIDTATADVDYTPVSGTLTFTDDSRRQEVHIPVTGDLDLETDETVSLRFMNAVGLGLSRYFAVGTIVNDDSSNVVVSLTPLVSMIREGHDGTQQVELFVTLIGKPTTDVSVNYATADHRAIAGSDYIASTGRVTFTLADIADGLSQKSIFVTVNGDTDIEPDEGFSVSLSLPTDPPNVSLDPDKLLARVVIRNDDQAVLTEDGDALSADLLTDLSSLLNAGGGAKNNPALVAEMQRRAVLIVRSLGLTKAIILIIDPVDFVVTDPSGRQSGYTEDTGSTNQIPGTYYSGDGAVELLIVPLPPDGTYNVQLAGLGGDFNASITVVDNNGTTTNIVSQNLSDGATSSISFQVGNNSTTIPVGLGLAAANATASAVGVVGAFGQAEFRLALASALERTLSDEFDLDEPDPRATGLMYWLSVSARTLRQQVIEPLWRSLGTPLGDLLGEGQFTRIAIPSEFIDQFWSQVGQTLTGVPSGIYRLGNMLESVIPTLVPRRVRSAPPRSGDQGQPNSTPGNNGVKTRRSSLERPRVTPPNGQVQPPSKPNATKDKSAQTPDSKKTDGQQSSTSHTRWLWFTFKDEKSASKPVDRRGV